MADPHDQPAGPDSDASPDEVAGDAAAHRDERLGEHNVFAVFGDMDAARKAINGLERRGIDGDAISLLGQGADEASTSGETAQRDASLTGDVAKKVATGAAAGTAAGGTAGLIAGAAAMTIPGIGPVVGGGILAAVLGGAIAGGSVSGVASGVAATKLSEAWELAHQSVTTNQIVVAVHADDPEDADGAAEELGKHGAATVQRFDAEGRRVRSA